MLPYKALESRVSEMPLLAFFAGHFQQINTQENVVVSCLFYSSRVLSVMCIAYAKKKPVTQSELWNNERIKEILTQRHQYSAENVSVILI